MIQVSYKNKNQEVRALLYNENNLSELWYDIQLLINEWAENIKCF